jgi:hypothetical protein
MREKRNSHTGLVRGHEGKRPRGRSVFGLEDVIKMNIKQMDWKIESGFTWIRIKSSGGFREHGNDYYRSIKCWVYLH